MLRKSLVASLAFASAVFGGGVSTAGPSSSYCKGVDVSKYQGTINWSAVAANGITFGIARVSDGTGNPDAYFQRNWSGMKANGIVRGVYQFFRPEESAVAQADLLINAVSFEPGDMPPFLDVEVTDGVSWSGIHAGIAAWCNEIQAKTGLTPLIYTAPGLWQGSPPPGVGLWIANWGTSSPRLASGWNNWVFWQYTDSTYPSASDGDVFHGSLADLQAWCAANGPGGSPTTTTTTSTSTSGSSSTAGYPTLREGSTGNYVVILQTNLTNQGYSTGGIDGDFGPHTLAAVKSFQSANGLVADGIVGPLTWAAVGP